MDKNKDVILTSYSQTGNTNSIIRSSSLTTHLIDVQDGVLTLQNITINGNDVPSQDSMIDVASEVYMEEGTLITKANNVNDWGGGFIVNVGTIIWTAGIMTMTGGKIMNNTSHNNVGGIYVIGIYKYVSGVVCGNTPANKYETSTTCPN